MKKILAFMKNPYWSFIGTVLAVFAFFGISSGNFIATFGKFSWLIDATKWSLIFGAFIFGIHAYLRAEKNRKALLNIENSTYNEAFKKFSNEMSYALGRYKGYSENLAPDNTKYTIIGVMERINEVKSARMQLLSVCGEHIRSVLLEEGTDWLDNIESFAKTAPLIMDKLSKIALKDRV